MLSYHRSDGKKNLQSKFLPIVLWYPQISLNSVTSPIPNISILGWFSRTMTLKKLTASTSKFNRPNLSVSNLNVLHFSSLSPSSINILLIKSKKTCPLVSLKISLLAKVTLLISVKIHDKESRWSNQKVYSNNKWLASYRILCQLQSFHQKSIFFFNFRKVWVR